MQDLSLYLALGASRAHWWRVVEVSEVEEREQHGCCGLPHSSYRASQSSSARSARIVRTALSDVDRQSVVRNVL